MSIIVVYMVIASGDYIAHSLVAQRAADCTTRTLNPQLLVSILTTRLIAVASRSLNMLIIH